jgi:uncharacterized membrane protein (UPF0182 family)
MLTAKTALMFPIAPQLSAQLTLWNQRGSRVRRGSLPVIPIGHGLLYVQPILSPGGAEPDAGASSRRARAAGSRRVRAHVR